jgi:protein ImuA
MLPVMTRPIAPHLLDRSARRPAAGAVQGQRLLGDLTLAPGRVHEFCGPARRTLALTLARAMTGPVFWIAPAWMPGRPNPEGVLSFIDPGRLVFVTPRRAEDLLWSMEEVLRAGAVPLVVADLPAPPALTPVRRLQLAAETGAAEGRLVPLGVLLTPGPGGAAGAESRWEMAPRHTDTSRAGMAWQLHRRRARAAPEASWTARWCADGLQLAP